MSTNVYQVGFGIPGSIDFEQAGVFDNIADAAECAVRELEHYLEVFEGASCIHAAMEPQFWIDESRSFGNGTQEHPVIIYVFAPSRTALGYVELTPARADSQWAIDWFASMEFHN